MDPITVSTSGLTPLLLLLLLAVLGAFLSSPRFKGWVGEALVKFSSNRLLPKEIYHALHDVTLPAEGGSTQIDHIYISRYGIFVVETKNMKGWIFGAENDAQWTQKLYKKSQRFQNPLRQNYKHVKTLEALLSVPSAAIRSVVVFVGDAEFKTPMPDNVIRGSGYIRYIRSFDKRVLSDSQVEVAVTRIEETRFARSRATHREHVRRLKARRGPADVERCPKCGSRMVRRVAKQGDWAGQRFWGCSSYPKCKFIKKSE